MCVIDVFVETHLLIAQPKVVNTDSMQCHFTINLKKKHFTVAQVNFYLTMIS